MCLVFITLYKIPRQFQEENHMNICEYYLLTVGKFLLEIFPRRSQRVLWLYEVQVTRACCQQVRVDVWPFVSETLVSLDAEMLLFCSHCS